MFVYIVGNVEQNIFRLEIASNPDQRLPIIQMGSPYELSIVSKVCVRNRNAAALIESLSRQDLKAYEGLGSWVSDVPDGLLAQLVSGRYLRSLADKADVRLVGDREQNMRKSPDDLQRLSVTARRRELTFQDVLDSVERAYTEELPIDETL